MGASSADQKLSLWNCDHIFYARAAGVRNRVIYVGALRDGIRRASGAKAECTEESKQSSIKASNESRSNLVSMVM